MLLLFSCKNSAEKNTFRIATAASVQFAMEELVSEFERQTGVRPQVIINSSGKITAQVLSAAPYDVFVSADLKYPLYLQEKGLVKKGPEVYAEGRLVIWSVDSAITPSVENLPNPLITHIAMASPEIAPYGKAARESLEYFNMYEKLGPRLVFGESISQTNQFIISGAVGVGFTALSVVKAPRLEKKGRWSLVPPESYSPIQQGIAMLQQPSDSEIAAAFYDFMFTDTAQHILQKYGYGIPETPPQ